MQVGDLVKYRAPADNGADEQTGVITRVRRNSMNSSDKWATFYVYCSSLGHVVPASHSELEVISASR